MSKKYLCDVSSYKLPEEFEKVNRIFFVFLKENGDWFEKITSSKNFEYIRQKMINNVMENTWGKTEFMKHLDPFKRNIFYSYIQSSALGMYNQWILDGRKIPLDDIVEFSSKLISEGIYGIEI